MTIKRNKIVASIEALGITLPTGKPLTNETLVAMLAKAKHDKQVEDFRMRVTAKPLPKICTVLG